MVKPGKKDDKESVISEPNITTSGRKKKTPWPPMETCPSPSDSPSARRMLGERKPKMKTSLSRSSLNEDVYSGVSGSPPGTPIPSLAIPEQRSKVEEVEAPMTSGTGSRPPSPQSNYSQVIAHIRTA